MWHLPMIPSLAALAFEASIVKPPLLTFFLGLFTSCKVDSVLEAGDSLSRLLQSGGTLQHFLDSQLCSVDFRSES